MTKRDNIALLESNTGGGGGGGGGNRNDGNNTSENYRHSLRALVS